MIEFSFRLIILLVICLFVTSCSQKSDIEDVQGTVRVQIPLFEDGSTYKLTFVDLENISNLREVSGSYARFFYAPGANDSGLIGGSPAAHFIKSDSTFIPTDLITSQMASIYYHMQKLASFDAAVGASNVNQWPRSIGLETRIMENDATKKNNAFYDGMTDSMMFVPFTAAELPIALNAGIIAHEHFHSLFYKLVIKSAIANKKMTAGSESIHADEKLETAQLNKIVVPKIVSEKKRALLKNEVYLRGLNEGLADFWGWLYTDDASFMKWSLPNFAEQRQLDLEDSNWGRHMTSERIDAAVEEAVQITDQPRLALIDFAYYVGTPHARFLKQWTKFISEDEEIPLKDAKLKIAKEIIAFLKELATKIPMLEENEALAPSEMFNYFLDNDLKTGKLTAKRCRFSVSYLNFQNPKAHETNECATQADNKVVIVKVKKP